MNALVQCSGVKCSIVVARRGRLSRHERTPRGVSLSSGIDFAVCLLLPHLGLPTHPRFVSFPCPSMCIGFEADRSAVGINEPLSLTVVARNDSSSSVNSMHIAIVQVCTWYARGYKESKTRTIASMTVPESQLSEVQRGAAEKARNQRKPAAVENAAWRYFQELLAAGAGTRYELSVPDGSLFTLQTSLIDVRHSLNVRLKTPALITTPDVSMPLRVQAKTRRIKIAGRG